MKIKLILFLKSLFYLLSIISGTLFIVSSGYVFLIIRDSGLLWYSLLMYFILLIFFFCIFLLSIKLSKKEYLLKCTELYRHNSLLKILGIISFIFFLDTLLSFFFRYTFDIFGDGFFVLTVWPALIGPIVNFFSFLFFIFIIKIYKSKGFLIELDVVDKFFKKIQIIYLIISPIIWPLLFFIGFAGGFH